MNRYITTKSYTILVQSLDPQGQPYHPYEIDAYVLPDGRCLTTETGVDGKDSLWPSLEAFTPNGMDQVIEAIDEEETENLLLSTLLNADEDNVVYKGTSLLTPEEAKHLRGEQAIAYARLRGLTLCTFATAVEPQGLSGMTPEDIEEWIAIEPSAGLADLVFVNPADLFLDGLAREVLFDEGAVREAIDDSHIRLWDEGENWDYYVQAARERRKPTQEPRWRVTRYTYGGTPESIPLDNEPLEDGDLVDSYTLDWYAVVETAGFDTEDENTVVTCLTRSWGRHSAGSLVVTGRRIEDQPFAVLDECESCQPSKPCEERHPSPMFGD